MLSRDWTYTEDYCKHFYIDNVTGNILTEIVLNRPIDIGYTPLIPEGVIWKTELGCFLGLSKARKALERYYAQS